jgi:tetratricopeptide (TPR) repeat protein
MTAEDAIQVADQVLVARARNRLTHIQRMILSESWAGKRYEIMEGYASQHIKNEGKELWDLLSEVLGEKVTKTSFKGALEKRLKSGDMVLKPPMPSTYNEQTWVGREAVVSDLLPKLQGQTRLLWIKGISGIGKTTLGECLASKAWEKEPSFQWIYLEILEGQSPDFASVAADLLAKLGDRELDPSERNNPDRLAKRLLQKLQSHRYWIQMDSLERLLNPEQPTEFVDAYWATFLQRFLTESNVISRLVLTAQSFPAAVVEFSDRYPNTWAEHRLDGLLQVEQLEFFAKRGVLVEPSNRDILTRIAKIYEGHPLVLKVIAEDILQEFAGDVSRYWQIYQAEFEQVARELQATRLDETEYNEALDRKVRERIKKSLEKLPVDPLDLLCRSAVFRRPVPKKFWLAMIGDRSSQQQQVAYRVLGDRALIEKESIDIRQHNLIRAIAYDLLRADTFIWHQAERQAANLWLTAYEPAPDAPKLETVRGYLEAFDHFYEIEAWTEAEKILYLSPNKSNNLQLHSQLFIWNYSQEFISVSNKMLNISHKIGNRKLEGIASSNLGDFYQYIGNYTEAIKYHWKSLIIAREFSAHVEAVGHSLGNLGLDYYYLGDLAVAFDLFEQNYNLAQNIGDQRGEIAALGNLGLIYGRQKNYLKVIEYDQKASEVQSRMKNYGKQGIEDWYQGIKWANLGNALGKLQRYPEAFEVLQKSLKISKNIGDREGESHTLRILAELHQDLGECDVARQYCQQALALATDLGIPLATECEALQLKIENEQCKIETEGSGK